MCSHTIHCNTIIFLRLLLSSNIKRAHQEDSDNTLQTTCPFQDAVPCSLDRCRTWNLEREDTRGCDVIRASKWRQRRRPNARRDDVTIYWHEWRHTPECPFSEQFEVLDRCLRSRTIFIYRWGKMAWKSHLQLECHKLCIHFSNQECQTQLGKFFVLP